MDNRRERFKQAENFVVYYGESSKWELNGYDIAIIEPAGYHDSEIKRIQKSGTLVLAYLSFLEIPPWSDVLKFLEKDDFLSVDGERVFNQEYGNFCADLTSAKWQGLLMNKASELLEYRCYDGLFIDTIGFLEDKQLPINKREVQIKNAKEIIQKIRTIYPDHIFIQNCGIIEVIRSTFSLIDGVCWENPPLESEDELVKKLLGNLSTLQMNSGLTVFLLLEDIKIQSLRYHKAHEQAVKNNFLLYNATNGYAKQP
ncbi:MAG: hypothetical protein APF84_10660 [Gracilibacter sp. BRH_c7a]|nr:MAG: hypothetical protein APF84_10660 [Gracilibacter sp. BRH_c7a]